MPKYEPIDVGVKFDTTVSSIHRIDWNSWKSAIEFYLSDSDDVLKIMFDGMTVVRVLDEFHISTEDNPEDRDGMVPHHFAYRVTEHVLMDIQSIYLREKGIHYQFITGNGCADVISEQPPRFAIRPLSKIELAELEDDDKP